jgi:hypothetical protein
MNRSRDVPHAKFTIAAIKIMSRNQRQPRIKPNVKERNAPPVTQRNAAGRRFECDALPGTRNLGGHANGAPISANTIHLNHFFAINNDRRAA